MRIILLALAAVLLILSGCTIPKPGPTSCPSGTGWSDASQCCVDATATCMGRSTASALLIWQDYNGIVVLVIVIGFLLMGTIYMVAYAFDFKTIQIFVKNELIQLAASAFILGNVLFFVYLMDSFSQQSAADILAMQGGAGSVTWKSSGLWQVNPGSLINVTREKMAGGKWTGRWEVVEIGPGAPAGNTFNCTSPCHIYLARAYLGLTYERVYEIARSIVKSYATLSWLDYFRVGAFVNIIAIVLTIKITVMPFTGLSMVYHSLGICFDFMVKAMAALKFQEMTLLYIQNGIFPVFLISGIILRSIWFLRKLGGLLIAIAIGVYTVYPLMYVLCWYTIDTSSTLININTSLVPNTNGFRTPILPWETLNLGLNNDEVEKLLFTSYDPVTNIPTPGVLDIAAGLMLPAVVVPMLNFFVTIAFIKTLSASLGGDVELAGLTRIL